MRTVDVEFDGAIHPLDALNAAAYRMIGTASCQIETVGPKYVCRLTPISASADAEALRLRFVDLVTDECLRERLAAKTEPVRNLILSLAFGALASETAKRP
jgi:His-Xaa-Ser system protein HxsD